MSTFTTKIQDSCAIVTIHNDPVNALSQRLVKPLIAEFERLSKDDSVNGIIFTSAKEGKIFISGADISEFNNAETPGVTFVPFLDAIERSRKPVVCVINGVALGGGLEFALANHYRIATRDRGVQLGLVELQIGLIPGAAGTQRLPRLVGTKTATEMMLFSQKVRVSSALKMGLIDEIVENTQSGVNRAINVVKQLNRNPSLIRRSSLLTENISPNDEILVRDILDKLVKSGKTKNQIRFESCANAIVDGILNGYDSGMKTEEREFLRCLASPESRGLMNYFFGVRKCHVVKGVTDQGFPSPKITSVAVLGGGTMGIGIAGWLLQNGCRVIVKEINDELAAKAIKNVENLWSRQVKSGRLPKSKLDAMMKNLKAQSTYDGFDSLDLVIEAVFEDIGLKQKIFADLEKVTSRNCILASNTSTIDINLIAANTSTQDRIIGLHFFAPSLVMPLVEVIRNDKTTDKVTSDMVLFVKNFRKIPIVVGNCTGFLINRFFGMYGQSTLFLVERGVDVYDIDRVCKNYGMQLGFFETADLSGLDIQCKVFPILRSSYGDRYLPKREKDLVQLLAEDGRLGQKTRKGYYLYKGRRPKPDPKLKEYVSRYRSQPGVPKETLKLTDQEIFEFIFFPIFNECVRCLEEGIALKETDIDVGVICAMGLSAYRGGFMCDAKRIGFDYIGKKLSEWEKVYSEPIFKCVESKYFSSKPSSSSASSSASDGSFQVGNLFKEMEPVIKANGKLAVQEVGKVFGFDITKGTENKKWTLNLRDGEGSIQEGSLNGCDVVIKMKDEDAYKLLTSQLDPMMAFTEGKISLEGDMSAAFSLQNLTSFMPQGKAKL